MTGSVRVRTARVSFIVHVYRHGERPGHELSGLVEPVEGSDRFAFSGKDELWAALARTAATSRPSRRRPKGDA